MLGAERVTITIRRGKLYIIGALILWAAAIGLFAFDIDHFGTGVLSRAAILLSVAAGTLTVLAWLEGHATTITAAFKAGCDASQIKQDDRHRVAPWN